VHSIAVKSSNIANKTAQNFGVQQIDIHATVLNVVLSLKKQLQLTLDTTVCRQQFYFWYVQVLLLLSKASRAALRLTLLPISLDLRPAWVLISVYLQFVTDVSVQPIRPIFQSKSVKHSTA